MASCGLGHLHTYKSDLIPSEYHLRHSERHSLTITYHVIIVNLMLTLMLIFTNYNFINDNLLPCAHHIAASYLKICSQLFRRHKQSGNYIKCKTRTCNCSADLLSLQVRTVCMQYTAAMLSVHRVRMCSVELQFNVFNSICTYKT